MSLELLNGLMPGNVTINKHGHWPARLAWWVVAVVPRSWSARPVAVAPRHSVSLRPRPTSAEAGVSRCPAEAPAEGRCLLLPRKRLPDWPTHSVLQSADSGRPPDWSVAVAAGVAGPTANQNTASPLSWVGGVYDPLKAVIQIFPNCQPILPERDQPWHRASKQGNSWYHSTNLFRNRPKLRKFGSHTVRFLFFYVRQFWKYLLT